MLRRLVVTLLMVFGVATAFAQRPDQLYTATKNQLSATKVVLAQQTAWNKGDLDGYLSHYKDASDTVALLGTPVRGLSNIRTSFHVNFPDREHMGSLEQTDVEARELGEGHVLITGRYHLSRNRKFGGESDGTFTEILEKNPTGWLVIYSQTT